MPLQGQSRAKLAFWKVAGKTGHQKQKTGHAKHFGAVNFLLHAVHGSFLFKRNVLLALILESNPHPFYSFRGLKNQMRIRIECGLD
jgi:hypothetical protein